MRKAMVVAALLAPSVVAADSFDDKAQGAIKVERTDDLVWAMTAACDKGDDVQQRQCKVVRDKKAKQLAGATLLVDGDSDALQLGKWSPQKKSVSLTLTACVRCTSVDVDGKPWFVAGSGASKVEGSKLRAAVLYDNARPFTDEAAALSFTKAMANAKFQLVVKVPRKATVSGRDALSVDIVAWRVVNPCDGAVVISSVPSGPIEPDKKLCAQSGGVVIPSDATIEALTPAMVSEAMRPVLSASRACFDKYKMAGKTKLEIVILADGTVETFAQSGDFEGTPTAQCISEAMAKAAFPKTKKPKTKIGFPITLQ
jgi:hypothetical protein